ncbi:hypothetical protein Prudu_009128 [Prunus dulcis]|uniref:FAR1 domain-containing protein n=1 Tax=Prunus dulcis TaxID=3755 RepID=A0A4Y1R5M6_PRUDU|nr:hypothetical protein Prudu_009128 [Prunus dulcis]
MTHELFESMCQCWYDGGEFRVKFKNCEMECEGQVTPEVSRIRHSCSTTRTCTLTGEVTRKEYVCCNALISTVSHKRRRRGCTRTGCKAKLVILKVKDKNKYIVVGFNEVHNHDMTTVDKVHLLRSHRNLIESTKAYSADMSKVNIPVHKQLSLLEVQVRGIGKCWVIGHDAELLKEHFMAMQEKNESFYFKMEVDSEGRMGNVFWSDARSRRAYGFFGDVVVFDTTFNTNAMGWSLRLC